MIEIRRIFSIVHVTLAEMYASALDADFAGLAKNAN